MARFTHPAIFNDGVSGLAIPHGSFYSLTEQTLASTSEIKAWKIEHTELSQGVVIENDSFGEPTQIKIENAGVYDLQFSTQLFNTGGGGSNSACDIWLKKNDQPVPDSNTRVAVNANSPYVVASWNFFVTAEAGDHFEIVWKTTHTGIHVHTISQNGSIPAVPSVIVTINQVA